MPGIDVGKNSIRARQADPGAFQKGSFRTITLDKSKGIKAVIGKPKGKNTTKIQTVIFPKKSFTVAQARKWLKAHKMKTEETTPTAAGKLDAARLRNIMGDIENGKMSESEKRLKIAALRKTAKAESIDLQNEFLDPVNLRFPISEENLVETLVRFNSGEPLFFEYTAEQMDYMGRKLARTLNKYNYTSTDDTSYDDDGNPIRYAGTHSNESESRYEYRDGQIVVVKNNSDGTNETTWERENGGENEMMDMEEENETKADDEQDTVAESENIFEAYSTGGMIKAMRTKKKMSRTDMAAKMNMSKSRLTEIEDDVDEPDDDELNEIAGALGMTPKRMRKMMDAMMGGDEEEAEAEAAEETLEVIDIVDEDDGVYDIVEIAGNVVENAKEEKNIFTQETFESREFRGKMEDCHKIFGQFVSESITKNKDGSITFRVPIFKFGELTSNGNRYMEECGENLKKHLSRINQKNSKIEATSEAKKTPLDIEVANYLDGRSLDMLATHRGRLGEGNPLLERAGRIIGGEIGQIEGDKAFFLIGETLSKYPGDAITEQITKGMIRGVSLFGIPTKFEENGDGGSDVYDMQLVGADFTDDGGNLIQFKDKKNAGFAVLN